MRLSTHSPRVYRFSSILPRRIQTDNTRRVFLRVPVLPANGRTLSDRSNLLHCCCVLLILQPDTDEEGAGVGPARWYERAFDFWEDGQKCALDDDGVLGGYGHISPTDISGSAAFLDELKLMRPQLGDVKAAGMFFVLFYGHVSPLRNALRVRRSPTAESSELARQSGTVKDDCAEVGCGETCRAIT